MLANIILPFFIIPISIYQRTVDGSHAATHLDCDLMLDLGELSGQVDRAGNSILLQWTVIECGLCGGVSVKGLLKLIRLAVLAHRLSP